MVKRIRFILTATFICIPFLWINYSCRKIDLQREISIITDTAINISSNTATLIGTINDIGTGVNSFGHCWSVESTPTILDSISVFKNNSEDPKFNSILDELIPNMRYYYRAYCNSEDKITYGELKYFLTNNYGLPIFNSTEVRIINDKTFKVITELSDLGEGIDTIYQFGHCWAKGKNPTMEDSASALGMTESPITFSTLIEDLTSLEIYYIRPYCINRTGIHYGDEVNAAISGELPQVKILTVDSVTTNSIQYEAEVVNTGEYTVVERGICLSLSENPTLEDVVYINGLGTGIFNGLVENLERFTNYYLRAYAKNASGVGFSNAVEIKTLPEYPIISTLETKDITINSALAGGNLTDNGGEEISSIGVCVSQKDPPDLTNEVYYSKSNLNSFEVEISLSRENTKYFVRAFAANSRGTVYGETDSFFTDYSHDTLTIIDGRDGQRYLTVKIGNQWWMAENLNYTIGAKSGFSDQSFYMKEYGQQYFYTDDVCPSGYHLPNDDEWLKLANTLGGMHVAGGKLKSTGTQYWVAPNFGATNESNFSAVAAGNGYFADPEMPEYGYHGFGEKAIYFSLSANRSNPTVFILSTDNQELKQHFILAEETASIRCVKD